MAALTADANLRRRHGGGRNFGYPCAPSVRVFRNALVAVNASKQAIPAGTSGAVAIVGIARAQVDNRASTDPGPPVECERAVVPLAASPAIAAADIGAAVYAVDDATVSTSSSSGTRLACGRVAGIENNIAWIEV